MQQAANLEKFRKAYIRILERQYMEMMIYGVMNSQKYTPELLRIARQLATEAS